MLLKDFSLWKRHALVQACVFALVAQSITPAFAATQDNSANTQTPIKHVIVIIGENRTFDHVFATYRPKKGERISNLLSKKIINEDGTPGPNYFVATQWSASDTQDDKYQMSPAEKTLYSNLPPPLAGGPTDAPFSTIDAAKQVENGLPDDYYQFLTTGGTGLKAGTPDTVERFLAGVPANVEHDEILDLRLPQKTRGRDLFSFMHLDCVTSQDSGARLALVPHGYRAPQWSGGFCFRRTMEVNRNIKSPDPISGLLGVSEVF